MARKSYVLSVRNRVTSNQNAGWTKPNCSAPIAGRRESTIRTTSALSLRKNLRTRKMTPTGKMTERKGIRLGQQEAAKRTNQKILQRMKKRKIRTPELQLHS